MAYQHQPSARDAGLTRVAVLTAALTVVGVAGTAGIGVAIAGAAPAPKKAGTDYTKPAPQKQKQKTGTGTVAPPADHPESSSGDEDTSSGGS